MDLNRCSKYGQMKKEAVAKLEHQIAGRASHDYTSEIIVLQQSLKTRTIRLMRKKTVY